MRGATKTWLLYDGDCRICTAAARWVGRLDIRGAISIRSLQDAGDLLPNVPGDEILDAVRAIDAKGRRREGGEALLAVLAAFLDGEALETMLLRSAAIVRAAKRIYAVLVEFRGHLVCRIPAAVPTSAVR
jgi:predicted DCC family thiol-disulfide oxidoreductase YuxK